jgi:hypothetical protein
MLEGFMKLRTLAAACAAFTTLAAAGSALAAEPVTAKLAAPVAEKTKFIAGGAIFVCEGDTCIASAATSQTFGSSTCRAVADKVGPVTEFTGRKALDESRLADCNARAVAKANTRLAKQ